jgi:exonuclease V gamma subunit
MRRGQALKHNKDFDLAIADFKAAKTLEEKQDGEVEKWIKATLEDKDHEEKIKAIMMNSNALMGKEYIDYLLAFLRGQKDSDGSVQQKAESGQKKGKRKQICFHELGEE